MIGIALAIFFVNILIIVIVIIVSKMTKKDKFVGRGDNRIPCRGDSCALQDRGDRRDRRDRMIPCKGDSCSPCSSFNNDHCKQLCRENEPPNNQRDCVNLCEYIESWCES